MELTKEERHEIYKRALEWLIKHKQGGDIYGQHGLCLLLLIKPIGRFELEDFPEVLAHKPEVVKGCWWPIDIDDPNRERVLRDAIEKTKP